MNKARKKKKIAIIGPYPKPYGGIGIHIQRVIDIFKKRNIPFDFFNEMEHSDYIGKCYPFFAYSKIEFFQNIVPSLLKLSFCNYKVIHHHSPNTGIRLILSFLGIFKKNIYLHIHGPSLHLAIKKTNIYSKLLFRFIRFSNIIVDNEDIYRLVKKINPRSLYLIDAFIPPVYSYDIYKKFKQMYPISKSKHNIIISMVGWFTELYVDDAYGFDLIAEAINILKNKGYSILVIASINGIHSKKTYKNFLHILKKYQIKENFRLIFEELDEIWPIYIISDIFIRPTNSDGSALSIKEALWVGAPVIASDCLKRPKNTVLFKNRDFKSLAWKIEYFIHNPRIINNEEEKLKIFENQKFSNVLFKEIYQIES